MRILPAFVVPALVLFFPGWFSGLAVAAVHDCALEKQLLESDLVDVREVDATIAVELKYASANNFMKADVYGGLTKCYLQREAAEKLARANALLKERRPDLYLLIVDGARPRRVQWRMWNLVRKTPMQNYVAHPRRGSMHNYGCAVDVTVTDESGRRLDMGTPMDHFGALAEPRLENAFLKKGLLTPGQSANRRLLREVMVAAGFIPLPIEWWHFDAFEKKAVRDTYAIIE